MYSSNSNTEPSSRFPNLKEVNPDIGLGELLGFGKSAFGSAASGRSRPRLNFSHVEGSDKVIPVSGGVFKGIGIDKNAVSKLPEEIGKLNIEGSANLERSKNLKDVSFNVSAEKKTHFSFGSSDNAAKSCVTNVASELPNELKKLNIGKGSSSLDVFEHVTLEEAFHPFINDASSESRPTVLNDATDEDLVFATQQMDINYDERRRGYGWVILCFSF
ncbi:hypothetical protein RHGRI_024973 [Rhododendron griersonianum]|uniref:Uncharacterized protein n=1 Tax=Rhododendron griersonianum TaxID=479676 RepID=A0AAV6JE73_9ERIC|nr:hypothetical protein RHGRI_024973 [Rhododendron griersonianum]